MSKDIYGREWMIMMVSPLLDRDFIEQYGEDIIQYL